MTPTSSASQPSAATRQRIVQAALKTLKSEGFAGASARAIARMGSFNQALIFYHFGSVNNLLLAALEHTSAERMKRYRRAVADAASLEELAIVAGRIYKEDIEAGHITVLSEIIAGSLSHPELRPEVIARMEPWIDFCEDAITRVLRDSDIGQFLPTRDLAYAITSFYLGVNLLTHLDDDRARVESLFEAAARLAPVLSPILGIGRAGPGTD
jgi:AcrR family transcriptional regulator